MDMSRRVARRRRRTNAGRVGTSRIVRRRAGGCARGCAPWTTTRSRAAEREGGIGVRAFARARAVRRSSGASERRASACGARAVASSRCADPVEWVPVRGVMIGRGWGSGNHARGDARGARAPRAGSRVRARSRRRGSVSRARARWVRARRARTRMIRDRARVVVAEVPRAVRAHSTRATRVRDAIARWRAGTGASVFSRDVSEGVGRARAVRATATAHRPRAFAPVESRARAARASRSRHAHHSRARDAKTQPYPRARALKPSTNARTVARACACAPASRARAPTPHRARASHAGDTVSPVRENPNRHIARPAALLSHVRAITHKSPSPPFEACITPYTVSMTSHVVDSNRHLVRTPYTISMCPHTGAKRARAHKNHAGDDARERGYSIATSLRATALVWFHVARRRRATRDERRHGGENDHGTCDGGMRADARSV